MKRFFKNIRLSFDRSFSSGQSKQLMWLAGIMLIVYVLLGALSYISEFYVPQEGEHSRWYNILFQLLDPGEGSDSMTPMFAVIVAMFGLVIFGGMLISVMSNVLERRVESYTNGETDYNISDHVIIVGFNQSVPSLIEKIHKEYPDSYILLMSNKECEAIRDCVRSYLDDKIEENLVVIRGLLTAEDDIDRLSLKNNPKEIYVLGEEDDDCHDSNNLKCVKEIAQRVIIKERIHCHVQIDSDTTYSVLQRVDFCKTNSIGNNIVFEPFNFNEIWAQKIIATNPKSEYKPLDGEGITKESQKHVHLIIIGTNELASSIAINAAHILHFPNYKDGNFNTCSHITFIDNQINNFSKLFRSQYRNLFNLSRWREIDGDDCLDITKGWIDPLAGNDSPYRHLGDSNFMDIQWEFISGDVYDDTIQTYLKQCSLNEGEITTIALCFESSELNASVCLALPVEICKTANQILVRQKESETTINLIQNLPYRDCVKPFGMMSECYSENLISDKYGMIINGLYNEDNLPDNKKIQEKWDNLSILGKWSSIYCANMLYVKLRSLGLNINNMTEEKVISKLNDQILIENLKYMEHNRWNTEKLILGYAPLTKEEQNIYKDDKDNTEYNKRKKAGECHLDICSNEKLDKIDHDTRDYDLKLNMKLWDLHCLISNTK